MLGLRHCEDESQNYCGYNDNGNLMEARSPADAFFLGYRQWFTMRERLNSGF